VIGANPVDSGTSHVSFEVMEATELDKSVEGSDSIASRTGHGIVAAGNWVRNYLSSDDKPVEVISVQQRQLDLESEKQWPQMVLNTKALKQILLGNVDTEGIPDAIVSIAGIFRSGKSFLLNFFLRYLAHMEAVAAGRASPEDDWFEPTDGDDGIHDHFHWAAGRKGITKGIHMWPKPFVLRKRSGEKIAVVLMDSQGTEDLESDNGECVVVFALSTMISSLQIYNVKENINKQTLLRLHEFTQFANKALGGNRKDHKHFQSLVFLVRDSNDDSGFVMADLWKTLNAGAMRQVGEDLAESFEEISGFLMSHPGTSIHEGLKDRLRTYKNVLEAMGPGFKDNVKDFTQRTLNPETLITKQVNGETVTCESAANYIK
ncbi:atlastin, partial [Aphelenchoides avenae]